MPESALDVLAHQRRRAVGVARLEGSEDRLVLLDVVILPLLRAAALGEEPAADVGDPQPLEELREGVVPRCSRHREVERAARVVHLVGGRRR